MLAAVLSAVESSAGSQDGADSAGTTEHDCGQRSVCTQSHKVGARTRRECKQRFGISSLDEAARIGRRAGIRGRHLCRGFERAALACSMVCRGGALSRRGAAQPARAEGLGMTLSRLDRLARLQRALALDLHVARKERSTAA